ncbi:MAG: ABC transporter permease [Acidimicrobiia bacterium]
MAGYLGLFAAGFRRQATYRWALVSGMAANVFFGVFRTAAFLALYRQVDQAGGLERADALTYVWVLQAVFGVVFAPWQMELPEAVRSGDFVVDVLRPGDPLARLAANDVGRSTFFLLARGVPQILLPGLFLDLRLPTTPGGVALLALALLLSAAAAFEIRFLVSVPAFWTADYRGWMSVFFVAMWMVGGFILPVEYFPGALRWIAEHGPLSALLAMPARVASGRDALDAVALQLAWVAVLAVACRAAMRGALRRMVVHGG